MFTIVEIIMTLVVFLSVICHTYTFHCPKSPIRSERFDIVFAHISPQGTVSSTSGGVITTSAPYLYSIAVVMVMGGDVTCVYCV